MSDQKRRKWTAAEKLRIVLTCMQPGVEVSGVCRREGINPTQSYTWKKKLLASAGQVFDERGKRPDAKQERLERELAQMKDVVAGPCQITLSISARECSSVRCVASPKATMPERAASRINESTRAYSTAVAPRCLPKNRRMCRSRVFMSLRAENGCADRDQPQTGGGSSLLKV